MKLLKRHIPFADRIRRDGNLKDLLRNSALMYVAGAVSIGLTFLQQISTANLIGVEDYGRFAAIMGTSLLLLLVVDFRTWEISAKLLARSFANNDHDESASTITWLTIVDLASGLVAALALLLLAGLIAEKMLHAPELAGWVRLGAVLIPLRLYVRGVPNTMVRLYGRFDWLSFKSILYAILRLVFISGAALLGFGLPGVIVGTIISDFLHALMLYVMTNILWRRNTDRASFIRTVRPQRFPEGLRLMRDLWISATLKGLQLETFIPLLALVTDSTQVGLYRIGLDIAQLVPRLIEPFSIVIQSTLIQLHEEQPLWKFVRYIKQTTLIAMALILPVMLGIILFGPMVFPRMLSEDYVGVSPIISLLVIGYGFNAILLWLRPAIIALDIVKTQNIISFLALALSLIGLAVVAPIHGAVGAALVMASFLLIYNLASAVFFVRQLRRHQVAALPN